ncbi:MULTISPECIES: hypothetical protein [Kocuria]|uniref:DNA modification methylase n=1 Tax=Kocuria rosea subsp. polaris TaxID=136273 RepID=A0A0W8I3B2_KOCRO|nr:hypothetical protein [Kocuria polaris]KUG52205.1 hypothetical protein AVL61_07670 [Kocuria polaris]
MKIAAPKLLQRAGLSAAAAAALLSTAGCAYINPPATTMIYSPADGIVERVGEVKLTNVLIVATAADAEGRVLGTLDNDGDQEVTLSMDVDGASAEVQIPANGSVSLEEADPVVVDRAGAAPGLMVETEFTVGGESLTEQVPVLDHTFERYAEFVPGGAPSTPANPSNTPVPVDEMVGQESGH